MALSISLTSLPPSLPKSVAAPAVTGRSNVRLQMLLPLSFSLSSHGVKSPLSSLLHQLALLPAQHLKMVINPRALQNARELKTFPLMPSSDSVNLFLTGTAGRNVFQTHDQLELRLPSARKHLMCNAHNVLAT